MENRGITFGYGFLSQESSFDVQFSLIEFDGSHSYFRAYLVGLLNTILVSVIGIIFATIIGVVVGIARLSNKLVITVKATKEILLTLEFYLTEVQMNYGLKVEYFMYPQQDNLYL